MLRQSFQRFTIKQVRQTSSRPLAAFYSASALQPSSKPVVPDAKQAKNRATTWSETQRPKTQAMTGPRFEQMDVNTQPNPAAAIELIAEEPVRFVKERRVACDGGGGPLGHPKVYINLDQPEPQACGYCGVQFQREPGHHH